MDTESGESALSSVPSQASTSINYNVNNNNNINNNTSSSSNNNLTSSNSNNANGTDSDDPSISSPNASDTVPLVPDLIASSSSSTQSRNGPTSNLFDHTIGRGDPYTPPSVPCLIEKVLPRELLLRVFSFLDVVDLCRAAQVSRSWNSLALDGSNWQSVDLLSFQRDITPSVIERLSTYTGGFLHALSLTGCKSLTDEALSQLAKSCPNLHRLDLTECRNLTDTTCIAIASYCNNLTYLNLSGLTNLSNLSLEALASSVALATKLTHMDLSFCLNLTSRGLLSLLAGPSNASIAAANSTSGNSALPQINNWTNGNIHGSNSSPPLISSAFRPFSSLTFFAAKNVVNLANDESISALARTTGRNLKTLLLNGCNHITDEAVAVIASYCPNIRNLALSGCTGLTDVSLHSLAATTANLTTLEVASCSQMTDTGLSALARGCRNLTRLDLEEVVQITDSSVTVLVSHCPRLSTLTLSHCENITIDGIRAISTCAQYLKVLELDNCPNLTDEALDHLGNLTNLERLDIYDCQHISRMGIRRIRSSLPSLLVHAYFAPLTPTLVPGDQAGLPGEVAGPAARRTICRCCILL